MKYTIIPTNKFKQDLKIINKRKYKIDLLKEVITLLAEGSTLPPKYKDHSLSGKYQSKRECHILPDWLLIYEYEKNQLILILSRTGTHSDLF